jgi:hypothetical protein
MPEQEGLYYPDGSFKSNKQLRYENLDDPVIIREKTQGRDPSFYEWVDEFVRRRDLKGEVEGVPSEIDIKVDTNEPIVIALIGDPHAGGVEVDYELLAHDIAFISQLKQGFVVFGGDVIDGFFFNPAQDEQVASYNQQRKFNNAMIKEVEDKILYFEMGDHDMWSGKMGMTIYDEIRDRTDAPVVRGSTKVNLWLPETNYKIISAHRFPGNSQYNDTHPENRSSKFGTQGGEIYIGWHTHKKAISRQVIDTFDGDLEQLFVSNGPYKYSDAYSKKNGWPSQGSKKRGCVFLKLYPFKKRMEAFYRAEDAVE